MQRRRYSLALALSDEKEEEEKEEQYLMPNPEADMGMKCTYCIVLYYPFL